MSYFVALNNLGSYLINVENYAAAIPILEQLLDLALCSRTRVV